MLHLLMNLIPKFKWLHSKRCYRFWLQINQASWCKLMTNKCKLLNKTKEARFRTFQDTVKRIFSGSLTSAMDLHSRMINTHTNFWSVLVCPVLNEPKYDIVKFCLTNTSKIIQTYHVIDIKKYRKYWHYDWRLPRYHKIDCLVLENRSPRIDEN